MKKRIILPILLFVSFLLISCTDSYKHIQSESPSLGKGMLPDYKYLKIVLDTDSKKENNKKIIIHYGLKADDQYIYAPDKNSELYDQEIKLIVFRTTKNSQYYHELYSFQGRIGDVIYCFIHIQNIFDFYYMLFYI